MLDCLDRAFAVLTFGFLLCIPLAMWKLIEIAIWFFAHLHWE